MKERTEKVKRTQMGREREKRKDRKNVRDISH